MNMFDDLLWNCHICKEERPDDKISVRKNPIIVNGKQIGEQNVRYCNDDPDCIKESIIFRHVKEN